LNIAAATPAWLRMPTPTTEILATLVSCIRFEKPMTSLPFSSVSMARASSAPGTVKVTSVDPESCAIF
jgi:hypothetical protein